MRGSVLVTGGAGYIGSVVVGQLLARGHTVVVLDDLSRGHRKAVAPDATFVQGGIGDRGVLDALLRRHPCDALVHLAAYALVGESVAEPEKYRANNVSAGRATPIPEDAPLAPVNPYGETKREFERLLADYASEDGATIFSLRYFNAAGATAQHGEDHLPETHLIPNVLRVASGRQPALEVQGTDYPTPDGTAVRDYVHVLDIADAHVRALEADPAEAGARGRATAVNLGTGVGYSVLAVVEAARRVTGKQIPAVARPRRPGDPPELVAAAGRAEAVLGWRPRHSGLEEILASAWAWHQAHPHGYGN